MTKKINFCKALNCPKCGKKADEIFYEFDQPRTGCSDESCILRGDESGYDLTVWNTRTPNVSEAIKLEETTNYLVTIARRVMGDFPYGMGAELYFISEDVKNALDNIGGKLAETFAKEIEKAKLQNKLSRRKEIKEAITEIRNISATIAGYELSGIPLSKEMIDYWREKLSKIKKLLEGKCG